MNRSQLNFYIETYTIVIHAYTYINLAFNHWFNASTALTYGWVVKWRPAANISSFTYLYRQYLGTSRPNSMYTRCTEREGSYIYSLCGNFSNWRLFLFVNANAVKLKQNWWSFLHKKTSCYLLQKENSFNTWLKLFKVPSA